MQNKKRLIKKVLGKDAYRYISGKIPDIKNKKGKLFNVYIDLKDIPIKQKISPQTDLKIYGFINAIKEPKNIFQSNESLVATINSINNYVLGKIKSNKPISIDFDIPIIKSNKIPQNFYNFANTYFNLKALNDIKQKKAKGGIISFDIETLGYRPDAGAFGITELSYSYKKPLTGEVVNKAFLFSIDSTEKEYILKRLESIKENGIKTEEDRVLLDRLIRYSEAEIEIDQATKFYTIKKLGSGFDDLMLPSEALEKAYKGLEVLSSEKLKKQTLQGSYGKAALDEVFGLINDTNNIVLAHNGLKFDIPYLNKISNILGRSDNIVGTNVLDTLELLHTAFENSPMEFYKFLGIDSSTIKNNLSTFTLENLIDIFYSDSSSAHSASFDALKLLDIFTDKIDTIKMQQVINDRYNVSDSTVKLNTIEEVFYPTAVKNTNNIDSFLVQKFNSEQNAFEFTRDDFLSNYTANRRKKYKFKGIYEIPTKDLTSEQITILQNALQSNAVKDKFFVGVLEDAYGNLTLMYGKNQNEVLTKVFSGVPYKSSKYRHLFFNVGAYSDNIQDLDNALRAYRGYFDINETTRSVSQFERLLSTAKAIKDFEAQFQEELKKSDIPKRKKTKIRKKLVQEIEDLILKGKDIDLYIGDNKFIFSNQMLEEMLGYKNLPPSFSMRKNLYHLLDKLATDAEIFLPIIEKINKAIPETEENYAFKRKYALSLIFDEYDKILDSIYEKSGKERTKVFRKPVYDKDIIKLPKYIFNQDLLKETILDAETFDDFFIDVNLRNGASTIGNLILEEAKKLSIGVVDGKVDTQSPRFITFANQKVNTLLNYLIDIDAIDKEIADKLKEGSFSYYYKISEALKNIKPNAILFDSTFELENLSVYKEGIVKSELIPIIDEFTKGSGNLYNVVSNAIEKASKMKYMNEFTQKENIQKIFEDVFDIEDSFIKKNVSESFSDFIETLTKHAKNNNLELAFSVMKDTSQGVPSYYLLITSIENSRKVASGQVLNKIDPNVAVIDLGSVLEKYGVKVYSRGGHQKILGYHIDLYDAIKSSNIDDAKLLDSMSFSIGRMKQVAKIAAQRMAEGDFEAAARLLNKKILEGVSELPQFSVDVLDDFNNINRHDILNAPKIYIEDASVFGLKSKIGKIKSQEDINRALSIIKENSKEIKKVKDIQEILDTDNIRYVIDYILGNNKTSPIYKDLQKFVISTSLPKEKVINLLFAVSETDYSKHLSGFLYHPSAFSPFSMFTNLSRPLARQVLGGQYIEVSDIVSDSFRYGSTVTTKFNQQLINKLRKETKKKLESSITSDILLTSQNELDIILDKILEEEAKNLSKEELEKLRQEFKLLNITNQESIIASDVADVLKLRTRKIYRHDNTFSLDSSLLEQFKDKDFVKVQRGQVIGRYFDKTTRQIEEEIADFDGKLIKLSNNRFLLQADDVVNKSIKIGIASTEKSSAYILSERATGILRKYLGNFGVIGNFELAKHESYDVVYIDAIEKAYKKVLESGAGKEQIEELRKDIIDLLYPEPIKEKIQRQVDKTVEYSPRHKRFLISSHDFAEGLDKEFVSKERAKAFARFRQKYGVSSLRTVTIGEEKYTLGHYISPIVQMKNIDEIPNAKGFKIDIRGIETMYRARQDGEPILKPFIDYLFGSGLKNKDLVPKSERIRIQNARRDVGIMTQFLAKYTYGTDIKGNVEEIDISKLPYYRKGIEFEDITEFMQRGNKIFGTKSDFVKIKLQTKVKSFDGNGYIDEIILPNVSIANVGENIFLSTEYQKAFKNFLVKSMELEESRRNLSPQYNNIIKEYEQSVHRLYESIITDLGQQEGVIYNTSYVRLANSGVALNKELFKPNEIFTAGKEGVEDIVYLSESYAKRLLGNDYDRLKPFLKKEDVIKRMQKLGLDMSNLEEEWGHIGLVGRFPVIMDESIRVAKFRVVDDKLLGQRQVMIFRHTSFGMNADVDADNIVVAILKAFKKMPKEAQEALRQKYELQKRQNKAIRQLIESEYTKKYFFTDTFETSEKLMEHTENQIQKGSHPFTSKLTKEGIEEIEAAYRTKSGIGLANLASLRLRQYASAMYDEVIDGQRRLSDDELKLLNAFTYYSEQKMINYKFGSEDRPILKYLQAVKNADTATALRIFDMMSDDLAIGTATYYAAFAGDLELAKRLTSSEKEAKNAAKELMQRTRNLIEGVLEFAKQNRLYNKDFDIGLRELDRKHVLRLVKEGAHINESSPQSHLFASENLVKHEYKSSQKRFYEEHKEDYQKIKDSMKKGSKESQTSSTLKKAAENISEKTKSLSGKSILKYAGIALAGSILFGAIVNPNPVKTRSEDDVGLTEEDIYAQQNAVPMQTNGIYIIDNDYQGLKVKIRASSKQGINYDNLNEIFASAFGNNVNINMNVRERKDYDNRERVSDLLMQSIM